MLDITHEEPVRLKFRSNSFHSAFVVVDAYDFGSRTSQQGMQYPLIAESINLHAYRPVGLADEPKMQHGFPFATVKDEGPTRAIAARLPVLLFSRGIYLRNRHVIRL